MSKTLTAEQKKAKAAKAKAIAAATRTQCKRFVIAKNRIGKGQIIEFTNKKGETCIYDHDKVYNALKAKFDAMPCFQQYKSYTNTNHLPVFVRELKGGLV